MSNSGDGTRARRLTSRGAATKARIVEAANQLMFEQGVALTTLADVRTASGTSKSQLYQHFADKNTLASIFHDGPVWGWSAPVASGLF